MAPVTNPLAGLKDPPATALCMAGITQARVSDAAREQVTATRTSAARARTSARTSTREHLPRLCKSDEAIVEDETKGLFGSDAEDDDDDESLFSSTASYSDESVEDKTVDCDLTEDDSVTSEACPEEMDPDDCTIHQLQAACKSLQGCCNASQDLLA